MMPAFLAWPALKLFFGGLLGKVWTFLKSLSFWQLAFGAVSILAVIQHFELKRSRHEAANWRSRFSAEHSAFAQTVANYRAAADQARKSDAANKVRVETEQAAINERSSHDFEARIAAARAAAERLQRASTANPGNGRSAPVSGLPASAGGSAEAAGQDGLSPSDALTATEQAIQLDELITWARRQHSVDTNKAPPHG